jgi:hypothetical protein
LEEQHVQKRILATFASALGLLLAGPVAATSFVMSDLSSDTTPVGQLKGLLQFAVSGSTLTISVNNQTTAASPFDISTIFFNVSDDILDLDYTGARVGDDNDWALFDSGSTVTNWKFGVFDYSLLGSVTDNDGQILHGHSNDFTFDIGCKSGAVCNASDFGVGLSRDGRLASLVGLRFVDGVGGDGAFGGGTNPLPVPEPSTALLLGTGLLGIAARRRQAAR